MTTPNTKPLVDIHCHLLPGIDDGSRSWEESLAMAQGMVENGTDIAIVTPHQLGNYASTRGDTIRERTAQLQSWLTQNQVPLTVLPGADVRIDSDMIDRLGDGSCLTLGDHRRHVLLELPHELYLPLGPVLEQLKRIKMVGILSHPERNRGLLRQPELIENLVQQGCLMQVTADSLIGDFGNAPKEFAEQMIRNNQCHFIATDAHGVKNRPPRFRRAYERVTEMVGQQIAIAICCNNPRAVAYGQQVQPLPLSGKQEFSQRKQGLWNRIGRTLLGHEAA